MLIHRWPPVYRANCQGLFLFFMILDFGFWILGYAEREKKKKNFFEGSAGRRCNWYLWLAYISSCPILSIGRDNEGRHAHEDEDSRTCPNTDRQRRGMRSWPVCWCSALHAIVGREWQTHTKIVRAQLPNDKDGPSAQISMYPSIAHHLLGYSLLCMGPNNKGSSHLLGGKEVTTTRKYSECHFPCRPFKCCGVAYESMAISSSLLFAQWYLSIWNGKQLMGTNLILWDALCGAYIRNFFIHTPKEKEPRPSFGLTPTPTLKQGHAASLFPEQNIEKNAFSSETHFFSKRD